MRRLLLTLFFLCFPLSEPSFAQRSEAEILELLDHNPFIILKHLTRDTLLYDRRVTAMQKAKLARNYNFGPITQAYIKSKYYTPEPQQIIDSLYEHAFNAQNPKLSTTQKSNALQKFQSIIQQHIGNLDIINVALSLVSQDQNLTSGSIYTEDVLKWIKRGLIRRLMFSGNGNSVKSPYSIVSPSEESLILQRKGVTLINTEEIVARGMYFRIHLVEDQKTGKPQKIYINFTAPIDHEKRMKAINNPDPFFLE